MRELTVRLAALDPEAGAALRVVSYFDELAAGHAGLQAVVRGAAVLTGGAAGLTDDRRHLSVRVAADGASSPGAPDPGWLSTPVDEGAVLWLERTGPARMVDAVVLERAAALARTVLERTRPLPGAGAAGGRQDDALLEVVGDPAADVVARRAAAHALGLAPTAPARAVVFAGGELRVLPAHEAVDPGGRRVGVGPAGPVEDLPASLAAARRALRLTAEDTPGDPGPRVVHAEQAQALLLLAGTVTPASPPVADVVALERAAAAAPWMLGTLHAVVSAPTRRSAATDLAVHHSTLAERLATAQRLLGWDLHEPSGQQRLHLALVLRRLHRNPA
ncbi:helix-turn-helix domain-containing protein [Kineococcus rubinsiae]|uniref:helix-turn-helix domain-containing protein n=1 Tax=Kineococcus rubinsiae TaxID=2609562 RepID=UPI001430BE1C|nr:helix-turn-helix domain-containing protein [Kineococcus rubinsiae]NIZ90119.1 PucR family transcriptional regulator [Kineococcus rubinsiae]